MSSTIGGYQRNVARPSFIQGSFFDVGTKKVDQLYTRSTQRITINRLLGLQDNSTKYIQNNNNYYLARGHLTAKTDFVYGEQQRLTFYFINAAPQWQTFNAANWETLESNVRTYASNRDVNLIVYTGTHGTATLPHEKTGVDTPLYLYVDENANKAIPIPYIYWKIVYEPISQAGAVFIGVNNPYLNKPEKLCTDRTEEIDWLTWKPNDRVKGFCYTCTYEDFKNVVNYLPDLEVKSLLTSSSSCISSELVLPVFLIFSSNIYYS